jgi:putative endonuclease
MSYYFYIIYSQSLGKYYIGHTNNLEGRISRHKSNHRGFTGKVNDWTAVYSEEYSTKSEAYSREMKVKNWKIRKKIEELINNLGA